MIRLARYVWVAALLPFALVAAGSPVAERCARWTRFQTARNAKMKARLMASQKAPAIDVVKDKKRIQRFPYTRERKFPALAKGRQPIVKDLVLSGFTNVEDFGVTSHSTFRLFNRVYVYRSGGSIECPMVEALLGAVLSRRSYWAVSCVDRANNGWDTGGFTMHVIKHFDDLTPKLLFRSWFSNLIHIWQSPKTHIFS